MDCWGNREEREGRGGAGGAGRGGRGGEGREEREGRERQTQWIVEEIIGALKETHRFSRNSREF